MREKKCFTVQRKSCFVALEQNHSDYEVQIFPDVLFSFCEGVTGLNNVELGYKHDSAAEK